MKYDFPGTKFTEKDSFEIIWLDGGRRGNARGTHIPREIGLPSSGSLFHGTEGTMVLPHVGAPRIYPQEKFVGKIKEEASLDHYHGFIDGCLSGKQPSDGFDYAGPLTEAVLLGNIAVRHRDQKLEWNEDKMSLRSPTTDLSNWLTRDYRDGWEIKPV